MQLYDWNALQEEPLNPSLFRKAVHAANLTVARFRLLAGAVAPEHSHPSEQISMIESGALRFRISGREVVVRAGQTVVIPAGEPHSAVALEDTLAIDVFAPRREDWIRGDDAYLRR